MVLYFFFFQAEDGIRDKLVTGVQTCALPIAQGSDGRGGERQDAEDRDGLAHAPLRPRLLRQADRSHQAGRRARRPGRQGGRHGADRRDAAAVEDQAVARGRNRRAREGAAGISRGGSSCLLEVTSVSSCSTASFPLASLAPAAGSSPVFGGAAKP